MTTKFKNVPSLAEYLLENHNIDITSGKNEPINEGTVFVYKWPNATKPVKKIETNKIVQTIEDGLKDGNVNVLAYVAFTQESEFDVDSVIDKNTLMVTDRKGLRRKIDIDTVEEIHFGADRLSESFSVQEALKSLNEEK